MSFKKQALIVCAVVMFNAGLMACADAPKTTITADAAYSTFAEAEVAYAKSGQADPSVGAKLLVADNALHDALKALSTAIEGGNQSAISLALTAANAELNNIGPIVAAINNPSLSAALATIVSAVASVSTQTQTGN